MELAVECSTSYNREEDVLTVDCVTLVEGQTITDVLFEVNGGELLTGRKWSNPFSPLSLSLSVLPLFHTLSLTHSLTHSLTYSHTCTHFSIGTLPLRIPGLGAGRHKIGLILSGEGGTETTISLTAIITEAGERHTLSCT